MKYTVLFEFDKTIDFKNFSTKEEALSFIKDEDSSLCQDGEFVKYYLVSGEYSITGGFIDRVENKK